MSAAYYPILESSQIELKINTRMPVKNKRNYTKLFIVIITVSIFTYTFATAYAQTFTFDSQYNNGLSSTDNGVIRLTEFTGLPPGTNLDWVKFHIVFASGFADLVIYSDCGLDYPCHPLLRQGGIGSLTDNTDVTIPVSGVTVPPNGKLWIGAWAYGANGPVITAELSPVHGKEASNYQDPNNPPDPFPSGSPAARGYEEVIQLSGNAPPDDTDPTALGSITAPVDPIQVNTQFTATASFTDDSDDTHTALWDWGDGATTTGTVTESGGSGTVQNTHTYTTPGVYTITLTVNNSDGVAASTQFQYVVVYDPNGGFVTGSGWINSPPGAYTANPSLTGKGTFGFNSKYQQGATVPTGNTEFNFKVANLNFHSTSYDWLVIAGAKAQYKGAGTINGNGNYKFMLTAIDGAINGGGGIDKFRIKITDSNNGLVYDNLLNTPDSTDPTTVLGGGDIIIHQS